MSYVIFRVFLGVIRKWGFELMQRFSVVTLIRLRCRLLKWRNSENTENGEIYCCFTRQVRSGPNCKGLSITGFWRVCYEFLFFEKVTNVLWNFSIIVVSVNLTVNNFCSMKNFKHAFSSFIYIFLFNLRNFDKHVWVIW